MQELQGSRRCAGSGTRQPLSPAEWSGLQAAGGRGGWRECLKSQAKTIAFSGQREIMEGSEQEKNTIVIPALLQEPSPGVGVIGIAAAMTEGGERGRGRGTGQKAIANDPVKGKEVTS